MWMPVVEHRPGKATSKLLLLAGDSEGREDLGTVLWCPCSWAGWRWPRNWRSCVLWDHQLKLQTEIPLSCTCFDFSFLGGRPGWIFDGSFRLTAKHQSCLLAGQDRLFFPEKGQVFMWQEIYLSCLFQFCSLYLGAEEGAKKSSFFSFRCWFSGSAIFLYIPNIRHWKDSEILPRAMSKKYRLR